MNIFNFIYKYTIKEIILSDDCADWAMLTIKDEGWSFCYADLNLPLLLV